MGDPIQGNCWHCGRDLTASDYGRETNCLGCTKPTHVCRNCRHYAPGRPNDCAEPMAEQVLDKKRPNFCALFEPTDRPAGSGPRIAGDNLIEAAEDLFK